MVNLKASELDHVRHWYTMTMNDGFDAENTWDGLGLGLLSA